MELLPYLIGFAAKVLMDKLGVKLPPPVGPSDCALLKDFQEWLVKAKLGVFALSAEDKAKLILIQQTIEGVVK